MKAENKVRLMDVWGGVGDPRQAKTVEHDLVELLVVAVCAVLSGADTFAEIEVWGEEKLDWLRKYLRLEHGTPCRDTSGRVFTAIDHGEGWRPERVPTSYDDWPASAEWPVGTRKQGATPPSNLLPPLAANQAVVFFFLLPKIIPSTPRPSSASVPGSGTVPPGGSTQMLSLAQFCVQ